ncbi:MAG: hypothetical protein LC772_07895, partial [Chloroflexi bacterium]|nr:hypothetical protein [Chloroflexota bacterium]
AISIGFIQFISGTEGNGSLLQVLAREKAERPADFESDFARYGINVGDGGVLVVVDPATGAELSGPAAVQKTIADKRLTAPFQRAGRHSAAFRTAQIEMAKAIYWPADDPVSVTIGGTALTGKISDVIHSEAGMATLFDRKVNTGTTALINDVLTRVIAERHLTALAQAAPFEREIVADLKYRTDFLQDPSLSQPAPLPEDAAGNAGGNAGGNGGANRAEASPGMTGGLH